MAHIDIVLSMVMPIAIELLASSIVMCSGFRKQLWLFFWTGLCRSWSISVLGNHATEIHCILVAYFVFMILNAPPLTKLQGNSWQPVIREGARLASSGWYNTAARRLAKCGKYITLFYNSKHLQIQALYGT